MPDTPRHIGKCELCDRKRGVRIVDLGSGKFEICDECEEGTEKAKARRLAALEKPSIHDEDDEC
ncbi:MAG TPA: hypothetical protein VGM92_06960 [Candidatus Kapabacteria bacterium]|jgi:hypothetical protein